MSDDKKQEKKPFKGVSFNIFCFSFFVNQAQVLWPADMPDDMLEDAIAVSRQHLDENEFEANGVEVSLLNQIPKITAFLNLGRQVS